MRNQRGDIFAGLFIIMLVGSVLGLLAVRDSGKKKEVKDKQCESQTSLRK